MSELCIGSCGKSDERCECCPHCGGVCEHWDALRRERDEARAEVVQLKAREDELEQALHELNSFDAPIELQKSRAEVRQLHELLEPGQARDAALVALLEWADTRVSTHEPWPDCVSVARVEVEGIENRTTSEES